MERFEQNHVFSLLMWNFTNDSYNDGEKNIVRRNQMEREVYSSVLPTLTSCFRGAMWWTKNNVVKAEDGHINVQNMYQLI